MQEYIFEGNISIKAILNNQRRPIRKICVDPNKRDKDTLFILRLAKKNGVPVEFYPRSKIDQIALGKTHGGMIAFCGERQFQNLDSVLKSPSLFLALVEGIEDPFNYGAILRVLYAAGCNGILVPMRNWSSAGSIVSKASAGASEAIDIFLSDDFTKAIGKFKEHSISFIGANRKNATSLYTFQFPQKFCIAIGGEMRGFSRVVEKLFDVRLYIPYRQDFKNAMSAASSAAIFAFEYVRQSHE